MSDVTANDAAKDTAKNSAKTNGIGSDSKPLPALDACYRQIGISAVAAAAQYQGDAKNPAYAPAPNDWRTQYTEELA